MSAILDLRKSKYKYIINKCSPSNSFFDQDSDSKDFLMCKRCQRTVHYVCSELPAYQITLCLTFNPRSFMCQNCVNVHPEVLKILEKKKKPTKRLNKAKVEIDDKIDERVGNIEIKVDKILANIKIRSNPKTIS